jgi:hypothetical protein
VSAVLGDGASHVLTPAQRHEAWFWSGAWIVSLLLALGRYGPLYRLFFMIPVASSIRGPAKFTHLVELSTAILCGLGIEVFLRRLAAPPVLADREAAVPPSGERPRFRGRPVFAALRRGTPAPEAAPLRGHAGVADTGRGSRRWLALPTLICLGAAAVVVIGTLLVAGQSSYYTALWNSMGFEGKDALLRANMLRALLRAALFLAAAAAVFELGARLAGRKAAGVALPLGLALLVAVDTGSVAGKYVKTSDLATLYEDNDLIKDLAEVPRPCRVAVPVSDPLFDQLRLYGVLPYHGIDCVTAPQRGEQGEYADFVRIFAANPLRFWEVGSLRYVFGMTQIIGGLTNAPGFRLVGQYDPVMTPAEGVTLRRTQRPQGYYSLFLNGGALPCAAVYHDWVAVDPANVRAILADPRWEPSLTVLVEGRPAVAPAREPPSPVEFRTFRPTRIEMAADAGARGGILLLNERHDKGWRATVDGQPAEILRCNGVMRGVVLAAGKHEVAMTYQGPFTWPVRVQVAVLALVALAIPVRWVARRSVRRPATPAPPR